MKIKKVEHPTTFTQYYKGNFLNKYGKEIELLIGKTNQTNVNSAIETERAIQLFNPSHILYVGVAAGLKDVRIGDIVIGSSIIGIEQGKALEDFSPRPKCAFSSYNLEQKAVNYSKSKEWFKKAKKGAFEKYHSNINVFSGVIASGEKLVASKASEAYKMIKNFASHALALEMEGLGFLEACRHYPSIKSLLIRGISDLIENKTQSDNEGSQIYASKNVAEFIFGLIYQLEF